MGQPAGIVGSSPSVSRTSDYAASAKKICFLSNAMKGVISYSAVCVNGCVGCACDAHVREERCAILICVHERVWEAKVSGVRENGRAGRERSLAWSDIDSRLRLEMNYSVLNR